VCLGFIDSSSMGAWAIALHGGAGMIAKDKMTADWQNRTEAALNEILDIGIAALENHRSAVEAVELVVSHAFPHPSEILFSPKNNSSARIPPR